MKISKDECDKEFAEKKLVLSDEKCKQCEYLYFCPFMSQAVDEVVNGDQNKFKGGNQGMQEVPVLV